MKIVQFPPTNLIISKLSFNFEKNIENCEIFIYRGPMVDPSKLANLIITQTKNQQKQGFLSKSFKNYDKFLFSEAAFNKD